MLSSKKSIELIGSFLWGKAIKLIVHVSVYGLTNHIVVW